MILFHKELKAWPRVDNQWPFVERRAWVMGNLAIKLLFLILAFGLCGLGCQKHSLHLGLEEGETAGLGHRPLRPGKETLLDQAT